MAAREIVDVEPETSEGASHFHESALPDRLPTRLIDKLAVSNPGLKRLHLNLRALLFH
jgi:hypothetical protein